MLTERERKIEKLIDSYASHDNHYLVSNNQVRHFLFTINHLREERGKWEERFNTAFENNVQYIQDNERLREERDRIQSTLMEVESAKIKTHNQWWAISQENEQLRKTLEKYETRSAIVTTESAQAVGG